MLQFRIVKYIFRDRGTAILCIYIRFDAHEVIAEIYDVTAVPDVAGYNSECWFKSSTSAIINSTTYTNGQ